MSSSIWDNINKKEMWKCVYEPEKMTHEHVYFPQRQRWFPLELTEKNLTFPLPQETSNWQGGIFKAEKKSQTAGPYMDFWGLIERQAIFQTR